MPFDDTGFMKKQRPPYGLYSLQKVRRKLAAGQWTRNHYTSGDAHCLVGWMLDSGIRGADNTPIFRHLASFTSPVPGFEWNWCDTPARSRLIMWNDKVARGKEDVLALLDRAIEVLENPARRRVSKAE